MTALALKAAAPSLGVAFGLPARYGIASAAAIGGAPPEKVLIFPAGRWVLADGELVTDAESFRSIVANFSSHGVFVVFDYEHMTLDEYRKPGELPIAAGFITALEVTSEGLVGSVIWTEKAAAHIAAGEYLYHSPVAIYDKATSRVLALHSCALTNTPRTSNQKPITEQVAAKIIAACWSCENEGGGGMQWIDLLMQFLSGRYDSTPAQKIEMLKSLITALQAVEGAEGAVTASTNDQTILDRLQLVRVAELAPVDAEVVAALGLEANAERAAIVARIAEMKTGVVTLADHEAALTAARTELDAERSKLVDLSARLEVATRSSEVETLIAANLGVLSPALREDIRSVAKTDQPLALRMIANITGGKSVPAAVPEQIAAEDPGVNVALPEGPTHAWRGEELEVSESSSAIAKAVRAIQQSEACDYEEASRRYHRRRSAA